MTTNHRTIETFFRRAVLRYAGIGFVLVVAVLGIASLLIAREQATSDLKDNAKSLAQAFKDRIIDGDIRAVEAQMRDVLLLKEGDLVKILKADHIPVYSPIGNEQALSRCPQVGTTCFDSFFGRARIEVPISMTSDDHEAFRYLYISKAISINWSLLITIFFVFGIGYGSLMIAFLRVSKVASSKLGNELKNWSDRIKENPKDASPRQTIPFDELVPLKDALDGLNIQIENFEKSATDKAKLLILRGIAHDLLTPVSQLQMNLATLQRRLKSTEHEELLSDISKSLRRVAGVASQVKSLKSTEIGEQSDLIKEASSEIKALAESALIRSKNISLEFKAAHSSLLSPFSKTEISRMLTNLIQNSVDASGDGDRILVSVIRKESCGCLVIEDHGKGIPKSAQANVFDPEFTLKPGTGTGLGLAVVKYICDLRSSKIELSSQLNQGTTISIQFPLVRGEQCINF
jgi:signal transduction histidine kinase